MARTLSEIQTALDDSISTAITNPSGSVFAEWKIWRSIFALAIWTFEQIMDTFKLEVETRVQTKQPGSFDWYYDRIMEFQGGNDNSGNFQGDNLIVTNGVISYENPDPARRLIAKCSLSADVDVLAIKVAKVLDENNYQALDADEQIALGIYVDNIKYPGTKKEIISLDADIIDFDIDIYYDPIITVLTVENNIEAKLTDFRNSIGFDDKIYASKLLDKIGEAEGVVAVKKNVLTGYSLTGGTVAIDVVYQLSSGYFNYDENKVFNFINVKTL